MAEALIALSIALVVVAGLAFILGYREQEHRKLREDFINDLKRLSEQLSEMDGRFGPIRERIDKVAFTAKLAEQRTRP